MVGFADIGVWGSNSDTIIEVVVYVRDALCHYELCTMNEVIEQTWTASGTKLYHAVIIILGYDIIG